MKHALIGAGGLGGIYGGVLARGGEDVTFIARGANLEALQAKGLAVRLMNGESFQMAVRATDDPRQVGAVDIIWFCVKTYDLDEAARLAGPLVGPNTVALPVQNGIDAPDRIAAVLGADCVLGGAGRAGGTLEAPGVVVQKNPRIRIDFGELNGEITPRVQAIAQTLPQAGVAAEPSTNIRGILWDKFTSFCGQTAVCAITRLPLGPLRACPETRELILGIIAEVKALARAKGIDLPPGAEERAVGGTSLPWSAHPSMYFDITEGKRLELEAIYGTVVRLGRELGVPTPLSFAMYALLSPFVDGVPDVTEPAAQN